MSPETLEKRFTDLQDRLAVLQDATNQLKELIDRLTNFAFQPGSVPLDAPEDDNVAAELSVEINQVLREQEEDLELLHEEIADVRPGRPGTQLHHDRDRLKDGAERLALELQDSRKAFRRAQIAAKRNMDLARRQERKLLYASFYQAPRSSGASSPVVAAASDTSSSQPLPPTTTTTTISRRRPGNRAARAELSKEEQMLGASASVTDSLRRTHELMAAELAKSNFAHTALRESTTALTQLSDNYSSLDSLLASSRALLGTLLTSQKTDTWYLQSAFYLLVVTIAWLVFRRILWGPAWWLVWLPLKLLFRGAVGVTRAVGRRGPQAEVSFGGESTAATLYSTTTQARMNNEGVPTARVIYQSEQEQEQPRESSQLESTITDQVDRIINESTEEPPKEGGDSAEAVGKGEGEDKGETVLRERREDEPPNPKKRMMEEDTTNNSSEKPRDRDEL
ncbi:Protein transport protein sec20 [Parahypoxylon ruwenzoriense]